MGMFVRVTVRRGGRRIACFRRRPQYNSSAPEALAPTAKLAPVIEGWARELAEAVRDDFRQTATSALPRKVRPLAMRLVNRAAWWSWRVTLRLQLPTWLLNFAVKEVHRCGRTWQRLRANMRIRSVRRERWYAEWRLSEDAAAWRRPPNMPLNQTRSPLRWPMVDRSSTGALAG